MKENSLPEGKLFYLTPRLLPDKKISERIEYSDRRFNYNQGFGHTHAALQHLETSIRLRIEKIKMDHCG